MMADKKIKYSTALRRFLFHTNHIIGYDPKIWLFGDGRSGTTWVSNLINHDKYFREFFEPFHPEFIPQMNFFSSHYYVRPNEVNEKLTNVSNKVFAGKLWNSRTDQENGIGIYKGLFVKDIFSNLFSNWVYQNYKDLHFIFLIRNPFAVASSKYSKISWKWTTDPMILYNQKKLRDDYLEEYKDLFFQTCEEDDYILNQILIWSVIHYVPLKQFKSDQIKIMFYENIFVNPQEEISQLFEFVGKDLENLPVDIIQKPSRVVGDNIKNGKSPITSWKNDLPTSTIDKGMKILEIFGLEKLYDENSVPNQFDIDDF